VIKDLEAAEKLTAQNTALTLTMCVNYGGRAEIVDAVRQIAEKVAEGSLSPEGITARTVARHLYLPSQPDVDLFVRTSGEMRTSNFMLWQSAYAEMVFLDTLWPDMNRSALWEAIALYQARARRFGGAVDQPKVGGKASSLERDSVSGDSRQEPREHH
jgi:undecaprenyl diphosphate synthase